MMIPALASAAPPDQLQPREVYLVYVSGTEPDNVRAQLEVEVRSRDYLPMKIHLVLVKEMSTCSAGDVIVLPNMTKYRGLSQVNMNDLLQDALEDQNVWKGSKDKLTGVCLLIRLRDDEQKVVLIEPKEAMDVSVSSCTSWESQDDFLVFTPKDTRESEKKLPKNEAGGTKTKSEEVAPITLYLCYGNIDCWPHISTEHEVLPVILARCIRKTDVKVRINLFDKGNSEDFMDGDVIAFPDRKVYRGLAPSTVQDFVQTVLVNGQKESWFQTENLNQKSIIFVCCEQTRTDRVCSVCGPLVLESFCQEVVSMELQQMVSCYASSHPMDVLTFDSEVVLYTHNAGEFWFHGLEPREARGVLSEYFLNQVVPRDLGDPFSMFWGAFAAAVDTNGYIKKLVDTLSHFILHNVSSLQVRNERMTDGVVAIQNGIAQVAERANLCDERAMDTDVNFEYLDILSLEVNGLLRFIYNTVRDIKKLMADKLSVSPVGPTAVLVEVSDLANAARGLLYNADHVRSLIEDLGGTPLREGSNLRKAVCDISIYP